MRAEIAGNFVKRDPLDKQRDGVLPDSPFYYNTWRRAGVAQASVNTCLNCETKIKRWSLKQ